MAVGSPGTCTGRREWPHARMLRSELHVSRVSSATPCTRASGVMTAATVLWLMSSAPLMIVVSSVVSSPPWPPCASEPCRSTSAFSCARRKRPPPSSTPSTRSSSFAIGMLTGDAT